MTGPDAYEQASAFYLKQFDSISIRETEAAERAREKIGRDDIRSVLDSVFLCSVRHYEEVIKNVDIGETESFVFAYILRHSYPEENLQLVEKMCEYYHADSHICANPREYDIMHRVYGDRILPILSVEEWIYYMKNAVFYFGDSYHGLCFSLIFHKPFLIVYRRAGNFAVASERFRSLLKIVGLEERMLEDIPVDMQKAEELIRKPIDWDAVDEKLDRQREQSLSWLKDALKNRSQREYTGEDIVRDRENRKMLAMYEELSKKNDLLIKELEETKRQLVELRSKNSRGI